MHKIIYRDSLIKQQTDFGHFNASDSNARLLCVSVLSFSGPWESREAQLQSSWGERIHRPLRSVNYLVQTKYVRQPRVILSITHYKGQEAAVGRHLNLSDHSAAVQLNWDTSLSITPQHILVPPPWLYCASLSHYTFLYLMSCSNVQTNDSYDRNNVFKIAGF